MLPKRQLSNLALQLLDALVVTGLLRVKFLCLANELDVQLIVFVDHTGCVALGPLDLQMSAYVVLLLLQHLP